MVGIKQTRLSEIILEKGYFTYDDVMETYKLKKHEVVVSIIKEFLIMKWAKHIDRNGRVLYIRGDKFPLKIPE